MESTIAISGTTNQLSLPYWIVGIRLLFLAQTMRLIRT